MIRGAQSKAGQKATHDWRFESEPMVVYGFSGLPIHEKTVVERSDEDDPKRTAYIRELLERRRAKA